eukprot:3800101-Lingulodinium_polyedra.AAC.1
MPRRPPRPRGRDRPCRPQCTRRCAFRRSSPARQAGASRTGAGPSTPGRRVSLPRSPRQRRWGGARWPRCAARRRCWSST